MGTGGACTDVVAGDVEFAVSSEFGKAGGDAWAVWCGGCCKL